MAKILVVEDNALNIKLFCDLLTAHGHETEPVTDSRDALEAARAFKPDLVITDIQLPYITGIELMEMLRADDELKNVPIMAVTAYAAAGDDERIRAAGAQAYVSKPISVMRFAETVDQLLAEGSGGRRVEPGQPLIGPRQDDLPVVDRRNFRARFGSQQAERLADVRHGAGHGGDPQQAAVDRREQPLVLALGLGIVGRGEFVEAVGDRQAAVGETAALRSGG